MNQSKLILVFILMLLPVGLLSQENEDYIEFNDRKNVVHGVYAGATTYFGEINGKNTYIMGFKLAYIANRKLEIGFAGGGLYSRNYLSEFTNENSDLLGGYGGIHIEPILFGKSKVSLGFPVFLGFGGAGFAKDDYREANHNGEPRFVDWDSFFLVEPGVNLLYNLSRYVQLEAGVKYRISTKLELNPNQIKSINGFSAGVGIKIGVFNLGRNRYKKNINED